MKILAIETSCDILSIALLEDNNLILELKEKSLKSHSEVLMPLIDTLLIKAKLRLNDIDLFACDNGPGSFTGIRIGLSTIKAFCDALCKPCVAISSLEALAYTIQEQNSYICTLIDAKHDNVYSSIFEYNNGIYIKYQDFSFEKINDLLKKLECLKKKIFFVGNCGILYKDMIKSYLNNEVIFLEDSFASSKYIGIAAFDKYKSKIFSSSYNLNALYLKKSSAEEKL